MTEQTNIVKVQYLQSGELSKREYTYYAAEPLMVGDEVIVPIRDTTGKAIVSAVNVSETEIEAFKDKVKTIPVRLEKPSSPADAKAHAKLDELVEWTKEMETTTIPMSAGELYRPQEESKFTLPDNVEPTALIRIDPDTDPQIVAFYDEALRLQQYAETRVITTVADLKPANDDLNIIRRLKKAMEARRKEYLSPFREHIDAVNEAYKRLMTPVDVADKVTTDKMLAFNREQDRIRREQESINQKRMEAAEAEMKLKGELSEPVNLVEVIPEAPKRTVTDLGSTGMRDNWKWEEVDITQVPRDYLMINAGMLTPVVKASKGKLIIPGIRIYNEPILATGR